MSVEQSVSQNASQTDISLHGPEQLPDGSPAVTVASIFTRPSSSAHVAVAHGYGIAIRVQHGQLLIRDGIGRHRRERSWPKTDRTLKRIIITGVTGMVSLEAYRWVAEHDISVTMLNPDGELVSAWTPQTQDARMIRRQVTAADSNDGIEIGRELLARKVTGQADNLVKLLDDPDTARRLYRYVSQMQAATTLAELNDLERFAAKDYFSSWTGKVAIPFDSHSLTRIPPNWLTFQRRKLSASAGNTHRHASDPINALLNFSYALGYSEARIACIGSGLHPALGFVHEDKPGRNSLALDVLEVIRPEIDAHILGLCGIGSESHKFTYRDFAEPYGYIPGTCRITAPLTHQIAEISYSWHTLATDAANVVLSILRGTDGRRGGKSLALSQQKADFIARDVSVPDILPDEYWRDMGNLLPEQSRQDYSSISNRTVLAAFIYLREHGMPLSYVPPAFGVSRRTLHERRLRWTRSGHWPEIHRAIEEHAARNRLRSN